MTRLQFRRSIAGLLCNDAATITVVEAMGCGRDARRYFVRSPTSHRLSFCTGTALRRPQQQLRLLLAALMFVVETRAALSIKLQPLPLKRWFYNGTHASSLCETTFRCDTSSRNQTLPACSCHPNCSLYDACCVDVRPSDWRRRALPPDAYECAVYPRLGENADGNFMISAMAYVFLITKCPSAYGALYVAKLCRAPFGSSTNESQHVTWVTDRTTGVTYRNQFCALCYNVPEDRMVFWNTTYSCIADPVAERFGLTGCKHNVLTSVSISSLIPTCWGDYQASCVNEVSQQMKEACANNPARYIYDSRNFVTYRNYNCSLCTSLMTPANRTFECISYPRVVAIPSVVDLREVLHTGSCPEKISTFATREQIVFSKLCPDTAFDTESCSETVGKTALLALYGGDGAREYRITERGLRLLLNDTYSVCYRCQPHAEFSYSILSENITLLVNNVTYPKPLFQLEESGSVTVCSAPKAVEWWLPPISGSDHPSEVSIALMSLSLLRLTMQVFE